MVTVDLKIATLDDINNIMVLCRHFYEESGYPLEYDDNSTEEFIRQTLKDPSSVIVMLDDVGMIIGKASYLPFSKDKISTELAWYLHPFYRQGKDSLKLIKAYEYWAKNIQGCKYTQMACIKDLKGDTVGKLYERLGYKPVESAYIKEL